jgi:hypothetical protein
VQREPDFTLLTVAPTTALTSGSFEAFKTSLDQGEAIMGLWGRPPEKSDHFLGFWFAVCGEGFEFVGEENPGVQIYPSHERCETNEGVIPRQGRQAASRESLLLDVRESLRAPLLIQPGFSGRAPLARE